MQSDPLFKTRAFQIDLGRQPEKPATLKRILKECAGFQFNQCHLYLENSLRIDSFGPAGRGLDKAECAELVEYASVLGIEIVPSLNLLSHTENFLSHEKFRHLSEIREGPRQKEQNFNNCLCPSLTETRDWAKAVIAEVAGMFPSPNFHVGLDETWALGSCPLCREKAAAKGLGYVFAEFAGFLHSILKQHGKTMWMWADMCFYYRGVIDHLPKDIVMVDWHYEPIEDVPVFSFFNWRKIDSSAILAQNGFSVVPGASLDPDNVVSFARYVEGLKTDTFLVTQWEGGNQFQDNYTLQRCIAGHILYYGEKPDARTTAARLMPDHPPTQQMEWLLAATSVSSFAVPMASSTLDKHEPDILTMAVRSEQLQKHVKSTLKKLETELRHASRNILRRKLDHSAALDLQKSELAQCVDSCETWVDLLTHMRRMLGERKNERPLYGNATRLLKELKDLKTAVDLFSRRPSLKNYPFPASELVLDLVVVDLCAHSCILKVSSDGVSYHTIYKTARLPMPSGNTGQLRIPTKIPPAFVKLSIGGYARVGISGLRHDSPLASSIPQKVIEWGGAVLDPPHILEQDRKSVIFNPPDVESKWLDQENRGSADPPSVDAKENYLIVQMSRNTY